MKWVNDKIPENSNLVHIKFSTGKTDFKLTGFYEPTENKWHRQDGSVLDWAPNLEWLDETERSFTIEDMRNAFDSGKHAGEMETLFNNTDQISLDQLTHVTRTFEVFMDNEYGIDITK